MKQERNLLQLKSAISWRRRDTNIHSIYVVLALFVICPTFSSAKTFRSKHYHRIHESVRLLNETGKLYWPDIQGFAGPWVYVTGQEQYLINANKKYKGFSKVDISKYPHSVYKPHNLFWRPKGQVTIDGQSYEDDPVFLFNSFSSNPKDIDFRNPIAYTSSFEIVKKVVPLLDTEDWITLFLHEVFHQFQFSNRKVYNHFLHLKKSGQFLTNKQLAKIYQENKGIRDGILKENRLLLKAKLTKSSHNKIAILHVFLKSRAERRKQYLVKHGKDLSHIESYWEMVEGGARYFEDATRQTLRLIKPSEDLAAVDKNYGSHKRYRVDDPSYNLDDLDKDKKRKKYFYTTGYNLHVLLSQLEPNFHKRLFENQPLYLEQMLSEALKRNTYSKDSHL